MFSLSKINLFDLGIAVGLGIVVWFLFLPTGQFEFVNIDDHYFTTSNPWVSAGLTWEGVSWAFSTDYAGFPAPLMWLSLMLDVQLAGLDAGYMHLVNNVFHLLSCLLVYVVFRSAKVNLFLAFFIAAGFAIHPQRIESVAWFSERKDVLWVFFGWLAILSHVWWRRTGNSKFRLLSSLLFVFALLSKPMAVVIAPGIVLMDIWPLRVITWPKTVSEAIQALGKFARDYWHLFLTAIPFGVCSLFSTAEFGILSFTLTLTQRLAISAIFYFRSFTNFFDPSGVCLFYPMDLNSANLVNALGWLGILLLVAAAFLAWSRNLPWLFVGFMWWFLTLLPVSGLLQAGSHQFTDRYTYFPSIGLLIITGGVAEELFRRKAVCRIILCCWLVFLGFRFFSELPSMRNSETIWTRSLELSEGKRVNWFARSNLALEYSSKGRYEDALKVLREREVHPSMVPSIMSALFQLNRPDEVEAVSRNLWSGNDRPHIVYTILGVIAIQRGDLKSGELLLLKAEAYDPSSPTTLAILANLYNQTNRPVEALRFARFNALQNRNRQDALELYYTLLTQRLSREKAIAKFLADQPPLGRYSLPYLAISNVEAQSGNVSESLRYARLAYDANPFSPENRNMYLEACVRSNLWEEAEKLLSSRRRNTSRAMEIAKFLYYAFRDPHAPSITNDQLRKLVQSLPPEVQTGSLALRLFELLSQPPTDAAEVQNGLAELKIDATRQGNWFVLKSIEDFENPPVDRSMKMEPF